MRMEAYQSGSKRNLVSSFITAFAGSGFIESVCIKFAGGRQAQLHPGKVSGDEGAVHRRIACGDGRRCHHAAWSARLCLESAGSRYCPHLYCDESVRIV